jgi:elongator complex protein 5
VITTHHVDIPLNSVFPHYPSAQLLLSHLSTTILQVSSIGHHQLRVAAESNALPDPVEEDRARNGNLSTLGSNFTRSLIINVEYKKKSGRTIVEKTGMEVRSGKLESLPSNEATHNQHSEAVDFETTFNLGISDRQKHSKQEVILPHFAAQISSKEPSTDIEYTMDAEDDFDDEEDVDEDLLI